MAATAASSPARRQDTDWVSIAAVITGIFAFGFALGVTYPLLSLKLQALGASDFVIGLNAATMAAGLIASTLVTPALTRLVSPVNLIFVGLLGSAASVLAFPLFPSLAAWFALRFLLGFCIDMVFVVAEAWLNAAACERQRGRIAGLYTTALSASCIVGPLTLPMLGLDGAAPFAACAMVMAAALWVIAILVRWTKVAPPPAARGSTVQLARRMAPVMLLVLVYGLYDAVMLSVLPVYTGSIGFGLGLSAVAVSVASAGMAFGPFLAGPLLDRFPRRAVACACALAGAASLAAIPAAPAAGLMFWAAVAVSGAAAAALYACALTILGTEQDGAALMSGSAAIALAYAMGAFTGPLATGAAMQGLGPAGMPLLMAGLFLLTAPLVARRPAAVQREET